MGSLIPIHNTPPSSSSIAWHFASLLLSQGHPLRPTDLASRSTFLTVSPNLIEFLCYLPHSPLTFTSDCHVTLSAVAILAVGRFVSLTDTFGASFVPRFGIRFSDLDSFGIMTGKRKRKIVLDSDFVPVAKRGITCSSQRVNELGSVKLLPQETICEESSKIILQSHGNKSIEMFRSPDQWREVQIGETSESRNNIYERNDGNKVATNIRIGDESMEPLPNIVQPLNGTVLEMSPKDDIGRIHDESCNYVKHLNGKSMAADTIYIDLSADPVSFQKLTQSSSKTNAMPSDANVSNMQNMSRNVHNEEKRNVGRGQASTSKGHKKKCTAMYSMEKGGASTSTCPEDQKEREGLPAFESYIVEEEVGSGAYGIVYKARRKNNGATVAIKCPHAKAQGQYVINELKVLERFGGKNFIIKYEGSFKNGNTDCVVLEHIEHDRPDVLRREIDILQLRWYGYCMFRALASLHKRGVIHRDVKPGNFLFSRKLGKGYLIDFNLAKDLHQNPRNITSTKCRNFPNANFLEATNQQSNNASRSNLDLKDNRRKVGVQSKTKDRSSGQKIKSQGADGSGVTSAKDVTSARTSFEKRVTLVKPMRKELISILQEAMSGPKQQPPNTPMRKRVPAPRYKMENEYVYISPMPLNSMAGDATGAGSLKGIGKQIREGTCVGTKGFRAPEVLFRSRHQGPKLDIWSAGVSLLYLITGRVPFTGDPEQNIKEIAKLRGSEDLWEVAKLHNRECSFPADLYDKQNLPSIELRDWCIKNTKRPEFLEVIPGTLFDLLDKCIMVNPRVRIGAEEALQHEFFAPCHEILRKERQCKKELMR